LNKYFLNFRPKNFKNAYGDGWVIITGGSDGIGKALADQFLKLDCKVVIVARDEEKMKEIVNQFKIQYPSARIEYLVYDFNKSYNEKDINELKEKLKIYEEDVSVLINNVGTASIGSFDEMKHEDIMRVINLNITGTIFFTKLLVAKMNKRKKSLIVFVGSSNTDLRPPYFNIYVGTKCFINGFTDSIRHEFENIDFTLLEPGSVESAVNTLKVPFKVTSEEYSRNAITQIGKYNFTTGHYKHAFFRYLKSLPLLRAFILRLNITNLEIHLNASKK